MTFTPYTLVMSILWFTFSGIALHILVQKGSFFLNHGVKILLLFVVFFTIRLLTPFEPLNVIVLKDWYVYPKIKAIITQSLPGFADGFTLGYLLLSIWLLGTILSLIHLFVQMRKDCQTVRQLQSSSLEFPELLECFHHVVPATNCNLVVSPLVKAPMVTGFFTPTILLPESVTQLSSTTWNHIFQHEWQHTKSKDIWVKLLLRILCCLLWWNPVAYLLRKTLDHMLELQCDNAVTKTMSKQQKHQYLQSILLIADTIDVKKESVAVASCYTGITEQFALRQRFLAVLHSENRKSIASIVLALIICILFLLSYAFILQPARYPTEDEMEGGFLLTADNAYIYVTDENEYQVFINDEFGHILPSDMMKDAPYCDLPIKYES